MQLKFIFKAILFLHVLVSFNSIGQQTLQLLQVGPDPNAVKKSSFTRNISHPLPIQQTDINFSNGLKLKRYYIQRYLINDTTKSDAVWFSILMGYDGKVFWLAADTNYDSAFEDEQLHKISPPDNHTQAITGEKLEGDILAINLNGFQLADSKRHPQFSVFLQPVFSFLSGSRETDSLVMNTVLVSGYKAIADVTVQGLEMLFAIQQHALMPDLSLFEYYNPRHQQMCWINLLENEEGLPGKLIGYENAYSFLVKQKPMAVDSMKLYLSPKAIDFDEKVLRLDFLSMLQTPLEDRIENCIVASAINLTSTKPFEFPTRDSIIFYFTGSWCAPCRAITPQVEAYFAQLPPGWKGYVVANEQDRERAKKYLSEFQFENMLYEQLQDRSDCSLKQLFSIGLYPSFVHLSPEGKLLWQGSALREGKAP